MGQSVEVFGLVDGGTRAGVRAGFRGWSWRDGTPTSLEAKAIEIAGWAGGSDSGMVGRGGSD